MKRLQKNMRRPFDYAENNANGDNLFYNNDKFTLLNSLWEYLCRLEDLRKNHETVESQEEA